MSVKVKDRHISKQHCLYKARELMGYILVLTRPREFDKDGVLIQIKELVFILYKTWTITLIHYLKELR